MTWYFATLLVLAAFFFMEFMAWFTHKYVMHGFLWILHKDHHIRTGKRFELNDLFGVIFAIPSIVLIVLGVGDVDFRFWIGLGIALYGLAYFLFHDLWYHQRIKIGRYARNRFMNAITRAHDDHHTFRADKTLINFGFLLPPLSYLKREYARTESSET
jgi:beta-carotene 3-hydroxylase